MLVPEAAMDQHYLSAPRKHQVRGSRQIAPVEPKPSSQPMRYPPDDDLWLRVLLSDAAHVRASLCRS
jgi:hypothetical protein